MRNWKYILIIAPEHYPWKKYRNRYAYEHHVNRWKCFDYIINNNEVVHHKDGNTHNNNINNLCLMTKEEHNWLCEWLTMVELECPICSKHFMFPKKNISTHPNATCSRSCWGKKWYITHKQNNKNC
jgi:hypothetical protein